ncbi:MAG: response regulator transcription factor [Flammeovirgaceae bacterium]
MSAKILLVEDDHSLGFVVKDNLVHKGYQVDWAENGEQGLTKFSNNDFDLCVLDVMMPKKDGFTLATEIRSKNPNIPILFVTAKSMLEDKLIGFKVGGDDYIVKPFNMDELIARIEVFLRRTRYAAPTETQFSIGTFVFDCNNLQLVHPKAEKTLTQKEAEVLKLLCANRHRVLKREEILNQVWGDDDYFMGRSLDVFISKLRKYLKEDPSIEIVNYHGVGFRIEVKI